MESGVAAKRGRFGLENGFLPTAGRPLPGRERNRVSGPPKATRLDEPYSRAGRLALDGLSHIRPIVDRPDPWRRWSGLQDASGHVYAAYDDKYLYIAAEIWDHRGTQFDEDSERWIGDTAVFSFDSSDNGGYGYDFKDDYCFWLYNPKPRMAKPKPKLNKKPEKKSTGVPGVLTQIRWRGDGLMRTYEVAIPWKMLKGARPTPGRSVGFNLLLLDDDTGRGVARAISLVPGNLLDPILKGSIPRRYSPQRFVRILLD